LILTYRFNQSHKEILYEKSHNAVLFILSSIIFYLWEIRRCGYLIGNRVLLAKETSIIFYRSNQIFDIIKKKVISLKSIVLNNRVFSVNKPKKFVLNKIMFYLKLYLFYEINVNQTNTEIPNVKKCFSLCINFHNNYRIFIYT